jgi:hypothetical protein
VRLRVGRDGRHQGWLDGHAGPSINAASARRFPIAGPMTTVPWTGWMRGGQLERPARRAEINHDRPPGLRHQRPRVRHRALPVRLTSSGRSERPS